jgi:hypothetical protein
MEAKKKALIQIIQNCDDEELLSQMLDWATLQNETTPLSDALIARIEFGREQMQNRQIIPHRIAMEKLGEWVDLE